MMAKIKNIGYKPFNYLDPYFEGLYKPSLVCNRLAFWKSKTNYKLKLLGQDSAKVYKLF